MIKRRHYADDGLHLGCFFPNGKTGAVFSDELARRNPDFSGQALIALAQSCERVGLDSVLLADGWVGLDVLSESLQHASPMFHAPTLGMAIAAATDRIGIVTTMHTDLHKPAHVARMGASLDVLSGGRWGWNIVTNQPNQPELFGIDAVEHDERYAVADEFTEVVKKLWVEPGVIEHSGKYFSSRGRIKAPRPLQQPYPFLVSAAASPAGMHFAAKHCDALMTSAPTKEHVEQTLRVVRESAVSAGRDADAVSLFVTAKCLIRDTQEEAEAEWAKILDTLNLDVCVEQMNTMYSGDASMPARLTDPTLVEKARRMGTGEWFYPLIGSPEKVAAQIIDLHAIGASGVLLQFLLWAPDEIERFQRVIDLLEQAGVRVPPHERSWSW